MNVKTGRSPSGKQRVAAPSSRVNAGSVSVQPTHIGTNHGTFATPPKDRLADLVLPLDAKPRQIRRVRVATVFDRSCVTQIRNENWGATNPAIASRMQRDEKFVRRLRDGREPIEIADLYDLPMWAVIDLLDDVKKARGIQ